MRSATAYYNENDSFAAAWLRELMTEGVIAQGVVDERSIEEVQASDLKDFAQVHLFAGIGTWSYALRCAGWPDSESVFTGSCPCPPFSAAGKKKACPACGGDKPVPHVGRTGYFVCCLCQHQWFADARHLWPEMWRLVRDLRPLCLFGEQVAGLDGETWLTAVRASLEILGYEVWPAGLTACGFGAPHLRKRLYFVAESDSRRREPWGLPIRPPGPDQAETLESGRCEIIGMANTECSNGRRNWPFPRNRRTQSVIGVAASMCAASERGAGSISRPETARSGARGADGDITDRPANGGEVEFMADPERDGGRADEQGREQNQRAVAGGSGETGGMAESERGRVGGGNQRGFWRDAVWLLCRDKPVPRYRPTKPGIFPLADRPPNRVGTLRGAGNAVVPQAAEAFIRAYIEACEFGNQGEKIVDGVPAPE